MKSTCSPKCDALSVARHTDTVLSAACCCMTAGHLGYRGGKAALNAAWLELDGDESGAVTFDELDSWVFGRSFGRQKRMEVVHALSRCAIGCASRMSLGVRPDYVMSCAT